MRYLLGIDIGTSACKVVLFDEEGNIAAHKNGEYPVYYPQKGWVEQNPDEWWSAVCNCIKKVMEEADINPKNIAGVGIDGQSWSAIAVDKEGTVLTNTPIWMDTRADDICEQWKSEIGEDVLFNCSKNPLKPSYTAPKVGWYKKYMPEVYDSTYKILQSNSFIAFRLTDVISGDKSQGYGWACFNMDTCSWNFELCEQMGIRTDLLPPIFDCHEVIGGVTKKASEETGLVVGTPVVAGGLDAACGALGTGVLNNGETQEQGGQAGGMSICEDSPVADIRLILGCHVVKDKWLLQGGTVGGGGVMRWFERELGDYERILGEESRKSSFAILDDEAKRVVPGSEGVIFLPYMSGERSPIWDKNAKGVFYGLDFSKTKAHMIRAALEGVAYSLKHNLDVAEKAGAQINELWSMGGAANSSLWTQIKADVTGKIIKVPSSDTATTLGAMILAGVGTGVYKSFEEAVKKTVVVTREHKPNEENAKVYEENYTKYLKLYDSLKELMSEGETK